MMSRSITWQDYQTAKQAAPKKFIWELAKQLNVSEAALRQVCIGHDARRLIVNPMKLLTEMTKVGEVLAITDNGLAVNEIYGHYRNPRIDDYAGMFLNPGGLDLRLFTQHWVSIFALEETMHDGSVWQSIQFFDAQGDAVHRIYASKNTDMQQWQALTERYAVNDAPPLEIRQPDDNNTVTTTVTKDEVEQHWRDMVDVHQFYGLLKKFSLYRQQAFRLVSDDLARKVSKDSASKLLQQAQQVQNEIMIFTGSRGCVQIYTGQVEEMNTRDEWINLKGHQFSFHLLTSAIDECWVVKKPTGDEFVTSLELFDVNGMQITQFYGARREGQPEQTTWRQQVNSLE